ncbi:TraR/DksA family transcriptional regulator [Oceaniglobus ichthyenteri]|uniref:TraR/DksA family transcriptional regulator n=1 Tax=Oceaniglobus ichthyenteri TaxID=2136177 RepID=UPI000D3CF0A0|nr:TraR/DksA family transcriptional regulator [Oceaniglobus ichthyenteri]
MVDTDRHKKQIKAQLQELHKRLDRVEETLDEPADRDLADQAIELEDDEVLEGIGRASVRDVRLLEAALERIENDTYGICNTCGTEITTARLDAIPYAMLCRDCAGAGPSKS